MKRQSILFILLLLQVLFICCGCGSSEKEAEPQAAAAAEEAAAVTEEAAVEEAAVPMETSITEDTSVVTEPSEEEIIANQKASNTANVDDTVGIFEGLEDNHTAIFSFDGAETAFYFEDPAVQNVLFEAIVGSPYTLSYSYDDTLGLNVIDKISE